MKHPMRRTLTIALILSLLSPAALADCSGPYPPSLVKGFKQDCVRSPNMTAFCGCVIDRIQRTITLTDFIETGSRPGGLTNDPRVIKATGQCAAQYPPEGAATK